MAAYQLSWDKDQHCSVFADAGQNRLYIDNQVVNTQDMIHLGGDIGIIRLDDMLWESSAIKRLTDDTCRMQVAAYVFQQSGETTALNHYFPITRKLDADDIQRFYQLIDEIIENEKFDLRLFDRHLDDVDEIPAAVTYLIAGHIAELFFYRREILEVLLSKPRHIWLYATWQAYADDGGLGGGCYHPATESVRLVMGRLFEGYNQPTPGVAPFIHEFGHMLEAFDASTATMRHGEGLLPGLRPEDGDIYTPQARADFIKGRQIELERYQQCVDDTRAHHDPIPVGHPYVFQNNTEFVAGYLEMFFRSPHYVAELNPVLYNGFVTLFGQDVRQVWDDDFPFYIEQNKAAYYDVNRPPTTGMTTIQ